MQVVIAIGVYIVICYVQKTLRVKNIGTLSKKFKMPEITDKERAEAAVMVEMQKVRSGINEYWKRLTVCNNHVTIT